MIKIPPGWGGRRYYMKADKAKTSNLIKTAKGQLEGILKMIEEKFPLLAPLPNIAIFAAQKSHIVELNFYG